MSYGRNPHYIINTGDSIEVVSSGLSIPNHIFNAILYKMLLANRRDELAQRLVDGKHEWLRMVSWSGKDGFVPMSKDNPEYTSTVEWMHKMEDEIMHTLMASE